VRVSISPGGSTIRLHLTDRRRALGTEDEIIIRR
jgi:hypothetical protein